MFISIKRTGGFAGIEQDLGTVNTVSLGPAERREVMTTLQALATLVEARSSPGADRLQFEITIQEPGRAKRELIVLDEGDPQGVEMQAFSNLAASLRLAMV